MLLVIVLGVLPNSFHAPVAAAAVMSSPAPFPGAAPVGLIGTLAGDAA
ncbi:hypothetical protein [Psychromarinibacter sp. S121]